MGICRRFPFVTVQPDEEDGENHDQDHGYADETMDAGFAEVM